jgi:hypothetical protein
MSSKIHINGMGVIGSFLALELEEKGIDFTWWDSDEKITAWRASTGAVFPDSNRNSQIAYNLWKNWLSDSKGTRKEILQQCVEICSWWYSTKNAPHGVTATPKADIGFLRQCSQDSIHVNAQILVEKTRQMFSEKKTSEISLNTKVINCFGHNESLTHYVWGWTRLVKITSHVKALFCNEKKRPSFYCREGRFVMAYAYPCPGTPYWYAGSSLIMQKIAKELSVQDKYEKWENNIKRLTDYKLEIEPAGDFIHGWRPCNKQKEEDEFCFIDSRGQLTVMPFWHNGIRVSPLIIQSILQAI